MIEYGKNRKKTRALYVGLCLMRVNVSVLYKNTATPIMLQLWDGGNEQKIVRSFTTYKL